MRNSARVKPIRYLKANVAEVLSAPAGKRELMIVTQNGEATAVIQDVAPFEQTQEMFALLKLLTLGSQDIEARRSQSARATVASLKSKTSDPA